MGDQVLRLFRCNFVVIVHYLMASKGPDSGNVA